MQSSRFRTALVAALLVLSAGHVLADWDAKLEAEEKAQRDRDAAAERRRKAEGEALVEAARVKAERQDLGKEAVGKSDAEVHRLWAAKVKRDNERSLREARAFDPAAAMAEAKAATRRANDPKQKAAADEGARISGATSFEDMKGKSPEELQRMLEALEKRAGTQR